MGTASKCLTLILMLSMSVVLPQKNDTGTCTINKEVVVADATVRFALMMSLRKSDQTTHAGSPYFCSLLSREPLQNYLAAEWVVERLNSANNGTGYVPGVKIGFYGMDDCRSAVYGSRNALSFLDEWVPSTIQTCTHSEPEALHIGMVGPSRSSTATRVASLLRDIQVPIISMSATSADLSNIADYPTFFRTVPSDDHQMNLVVQILEQMSWTYVAVVYSNDDYGYSASVKLSELAAKKGICIFKSFPFGGESASFSAILLQLIKAAKGNSIAIPFIGNRDDAENFLWTLNKPIRIDGREINHGFRLILSESTNIDVTIYNTKNIGAGTIAVGGSDIFLDDLYTDLIDKVDRVKRGTERHRLIEQYNSENPTGAPLISPNTLDTFVPLTVHAVFALAEALRVEHQIACNGLPGVCSSLRTNVVKGNMLDQVKKVFVDYKLMENGVPPKKFKENNYTVSFDANGDIKLVNKNPMYLLYQYKIQGKYEQIGSYIDGQTILEMDKMTFLTPSGQSSSTLPTSVCSTNCADCLSNNVIPMAFVEGDVYILGVFSLHETSKDSPFNCGNFRSVGNDAIAAEGFLYAVKDLRNITGINFGAIAIDDCYSPSRSTSILSHYFSDLVKSDITVFTHLIPREKLVGVVACRSSGCTIPTAHFFMPMNVPVVSYSASSPDLDSKIDFPYFLRTVPSDVYQAQVILDIVKAMKWEYVGLLYVKNNYGAKAMEEFKNLAMKDNSGVCVAPEMGINEIESDSDGSDFRSVCVNFINLNVKVVIFFGIDVRFRSFLSFMEKEQYYGKFIFIASEDWGINRNIYYSGQKSARGSITMKIQDIQLESYPRFKEHLASKSPTANDSNIWFSEFWQNEFNCSIKGGFINTFSRECDPTWKLSQDQLDIRAGEQRVTQVMNAVYALGRGLAEAKKNLCEEEFPCNYFRQRANDVVTYIKKQTRQQGNLKFNIFDSNGNGALGFDVYNIQQQTSDGNPYVKVGTFNSKNNVNLNPSVFQKENIQFYTETGSGLSEIVSKCSQTLCNHCPAPKVPPVEETKESSSSLQEYRQSDILLISLVVVLILAVLVAIAAFVICFIKKYQGLKKKIKKKEEIYDEPDRVVYQPYTDTHGIKFANTMNPYPIMNTVGLSNGGNSASDINGGVNNAGFISDIDSVSQVIAMRGENRPTLSDLQSQNRNNTISLASSGQLVSPYFSRPLPVSPIGGDLLTRNGFDSQTYVRSDSKNSRRTNHPSLSITGSQNDKTNGIRISDSQSLASGQICLVTSSSLRGKDAIGSDIQEGVVYYMQGPNGQLAPHTSSSPLEGSALPQQRYPLQKQASVRSQNSAANSSVNPSYGPYSTAAVQRLQMLQQQPQQMQISNSYKHTTPLMYGNSSFAMNDNVNNNNTIASVRPVMLISNPPFTDHEVDYSAVQYARPSHNSQISAPNMSPIMHYQSPPSHINQQQDIRAISLLSNINQATDLACDTSESDQERFQHYPEHLLQEEGELQLSQDRSPDQSQYSMISSSIPDVVGQSSSAQDLDRQVSLETINLSSSKESLDDLDVDVKSPGTNKNGRAILSALSALSGNISRV